MPPTATTYDSVPYTSHPYPQATPERMATIGTLFGLHPAAPERCRVLEIGCASAGHLLPLAEQFPESHFVGIDLSARQIAEGEAARQQLGLRNIELLHQNIVDFAPDGPPFDYLIAHGIFSWVDGGVQESILRACRRLLAPRGLAFISYNTLPGWHFRRVARDIMNFRARRISDPAEKLQTAKAALDLIAQAARADTPYSRVLRQEREQLEGKIDDYLFHEYLEEFNRPMYFHEFISQAMGHGLQFVGEAEFHTLFPLMNLSCDPEPQLRGMTQNLLEIEQYRDFIRNRLFRHTLLAHREAAIDRVLPGTRLAGMHISSKLKPDQPDASPLGPGTLNFSLGDVSTASHDPLGKAALLHLSRISPGCERFEDLYAIAARRVGIVPVAQPLATSEGAGLAAGLLHAYAANAVELSLTAPRFTMDVAERAHAPAFARRLAAINCPLLTNLRHECYAPRSVERHLLTLLDGTRDRAALIDAVSAMAADGTLTFFHDEKRIVDAALLREEIGRSVDEHLGRLAQRAFLAS